MSGRPGPLRQRVFVGSRSSASSPGIHVLDLEIDADGASLVPRSRVAGIDDPTYLALHPTRPVLYAVSETTPGEIVAFRVHADGTVTEWQRAPAGGDGPCHVSTDGALVVVANYASGSASAHTLTVDGAFAGSAGTVRHVGHGPHPRQEAPHAHCAVRDPHRPSGFASIHVVDLGVDRIYRYEVAPDGFHPAGELRASPGSGPRHLVFHPHDRAALVVGELDNTLAALAVDDAGHLVPLQVVPTLPDGVTDQHSLAAAVRFDPTGRHVYVSNRGHDSIAVFAHAPGDAPLRPLGHVACGGAGPRDVVIDPTGSLLLVANERSDTITGFDLRGAPLPRPLGVLATVHAPTCIVVTGGPT